MSSGFVAIRHLASCVVSPPYLTRHLASLLALPICHPSSGFLVSSPYLSCVIWLRCEPSLSVICHLALLVAPPICHSWLRCYPSLSVICHLVSLLSLPICHLSSGCVATPPYLLSVAWLPCYSSLSVIWLPSIFLPVCHLSGFVTTPLVLQDVSWLRNIATRNISSHAANAARFNPNQGIYVFTSSNRYF